jgi:transcriptional regulator with XRE-family HTH domain
MVNSEKFSQRLQKIFNYYDLSAAAFADAINVGRSSISHILSGRNKPSLDFVLKIVQTYPEVELYWLLNGTGNFPGNLKVDDKPAAVNTAIPPRAEINPEIRTLPSEQKNQVNASTGKNIQKIVIFYKDGTFEAFEN